MEAKFLICLCKEALNHNTGNSFGPISFPRQVFRVANLLKVGNPATIDATFFPGNCGLHDNRIRMSEPGFLGF